MLPRRFLALCGLLGGLLPGALAAAESHPSLPLGAKAPPFDLPGVDGRNHRLEEYAAAKVLVVVFTCNHCPTAQAYEARLKQLVSDYAGRSVAVVAISPNSPAAVRYDELGYTDLGDTLEDMKIRARDAGFNFPYLFDGETQEVSQRYGPVATPHVFIFDSARVLRYTGRLDDSERPAYVKVRDARVAIDALLDDREPPVTSTRVFGCSTKWADKADANRRWMEKVAAEPVRLETVDADGLRALRANGSGKVRLVNFWATWCGPCVTEFPDLIRMNLQYRGRDFELVTVAAQFPDEEAAVRRFLDKAHASTRNLIFGGTDKYALIEAFDPDWNGALPHTVLLAPDGKVLFRQTGEFDGLALRRAILPALDAIQPWGGGQ